MYRIEMRSNDLILATLAFLISSYGISVFVSANTDKKVFHSRTASKIMEIDIVEPSSSNHTGTVIFLHGSGGNGILLKEWMRMLLPNASFPHLKIMYPTAPVRPYTPLDGESSNVWFDRQRIAPNCPEDLPTINSMAKELVDLIDQEAQSGIPRNRIVLGGFSMGGAMALYLGYRFVTDVAGVFSLSSFLNHNSAVYKELEGKKPEKLPPLFYAHGDRDDLVDISWGRETFENLTKLGVQGVFHTIPFALHELKKKEMNILFDWINQVLPNK